MCEYCEQSEDGGVTLAEQSVDLGKVGEVQLEIAFRNFALDAKQGMPPELAATAWYEHDPDNGRTLAEGQVEVAYCPFCGRKLRGSEEEQAEFMEIKDVAPGTTIEIGGIEMEDVGLGLPSYDGNHSGSLCLAKDILLKKSFDKDDWNDWKNSSLRRYLNGEYKDGLSEQLRDAMLPFERDLTSDDGLTDYGTCVDFVSLISSEEYRRYRKHISCKSRWWWTLTPYSTQSSDDVCYLSSCGIFGHGCAADITTGVVPAFLLRYSTKVRIVGGDGK